MHQKEILCMKNLDWKAKRTEFKKTKIEGKAC